LRRLLLTSNRLWHLPQSLSHLTNLVTLIFEQNVVSSLPPTISRLTNLELLSASRNRLNCLPPELFLLTKLSSLFLSGNNIANVPTHMFSSLSNLAVLQLAQQLPSTDESKCCTAKCHSKTPWIGNSEVARDGQSCFWQSIHGFADMSKWW
jgi:Leucine-rich repeat (LRR) protein